MTGQSRAVINNIQPQIDCGKYYIKRIIGESVWVSAHIFADGHDVVSATLRYRHEKSKKWSESRMNEIGNDEWAAHFSVEKIGLYLYEIAAWADHGKYWLYGIRKKIEAGQNVTLEMQEGIAILKTMNSKYKGNSHNDLFKESIQLFQDKSAYSEAIKWIHDHQLDILMDTYPTREFATFSDKTYKVFVDRSKAVFSSWYEFFPRSSSEQEGRHGTFNDCIKLLPRIAEMGFDTLYFPPIHPVGRINRKGKNNKVEALAGDSGSPWGIGSEEGGHKAIHTELGDLNDFKKLIKKAANLGLEIAMDIAFQCAPDHPYVKSNPEWFKWRPDGTVQYAENPPKKYQDILPINFETENWKELWDELTDVVIYWIKQGVKIFRIDNPHTKPFGFWEYLIDKVKQTYPDVLFLAEAFTKPNVMHELAKLGFTQSYSYFTWRNSKFELTEYMHELTKGPGKEYFRPNFWPNTPDINPYPLQTGNESLFKIRLMLAATLSSNYGLYGPVYEFMVHEPFPGKEEYLNSEKYECKVWDWSKETSITELLMTINRIRKENVALQYTNNIEFCKIDNEALMCYFKEADGNQLLVAVSLDPNFNQGGMVQLPHKLLGRTYENGLKIKDLITNNQYVWNEEWNYIELNPQTPYHIFLIEND